MTMRGLMPDVDLGMGKGASSLPVRGVGLSKQVNAHLGEEVGGTG